MNLKQIAFASMTSEGFIANDHPELTLAIDNYCKWLTAHGFEPLTDALWMRDGTLNDDEESGLRTQSIELLMASRASGIMVKDFFFQTYMMEDALGEMIWRKQGYDLVDAGI